MPSTARSVEIVVRFTAFIAATYGFGVYLFPAMVEAVRADIPFGYGTLGTITGLGQAGFMACARLSDLLTARLGAVPLILGSLGLCALALGGLALATDLAVITGLLVVLAGCAAAIWVPMLEVARDLLPTEHRGKAIGLISSGTSCGVVVNSFLLVHLLPEGGWRSLWAATFALVAALAVLSVVRLRGLGRPRAPGRSRPSGRPSPPSSESCRRR